ncbi:MAG TPA: Spy/CpxP family protein refolding chaperone [Myxococcota bacterium]|nr:Spy/CpxP family protein refolding chaperone [Myxococcota bacterium]
MLRKLIPALLGSVVLGLPALAEEPGMFYGREGLAGPPPLMHGEDPMRILQGLKLTPDQEAQVHKILETNRPVFKELFDQLRSAQDALATKLLSPGNLSPAEMKPLLDKTLQIREQLAEHGLQAMLAVRAVLTPDQLAQAAERRKKLKELGEQFRALQEGK